MTKHILSSLLLLLLILLLLLLRSSFSAFPDHADQIVVLVCSAKSAVRQRVATGPHNFPFSPTALGPASEDIEGGARLQEVRGGLSTGAVSERQTYSGEVGEGSTMSSSKPEDDNLLRTLEKSNEILFQYQVESVPPIKSRICASGGP